jgi:hypothetical protein
VTPLWPVEPGDLLTWPYSVELYFVISAGFAMDVYSTGHETQCCVCIALLGSGKARIEDVWFTNEDNHINFVTLARAYDEPEPYVQAVT